MYPLAAETILKSTYMDDSIDSVETPEEGVELYRQLDGLWSLAGMKARKWISNSAEVIAATPEEDHATELQLSDSQDPIVKTLGIFWNSTEDTFAICTKVVPSDSQWTKRNVLKRIATVFDPLGFTSRRGVPKEMVSDNGTNFVGAVNELKQLVNQLDKDKVQQVTVNKGINWKFNPPGTPHFGGIHEIMVKAAKKAIYAEIGNSN
ncbi:hypothetical protein QZH41_008763, partial [Actinostola sp. cb2023]